MGGGMDRPRDYEPTHEDGYRLGFRDGKRQATEELTKAYDQKVAKLEAELAQAIETIKRLAPDNSLAARARAEQAEKRVDELEASLAHATESIKHSGWISVDDALPDYGMIVLVVPHMIRAHLMRDAVGRRRWVHESHDIIGLAGVTHWISIPDGIGWPEGATDFDVGYKCGYDTGRQHGRAQGKMDCLREHQSAIEGGKWHSVEKNPPLLGQYVLAFSPTGGRGVSARIPVENNKWRWLDYAEGQSPTHWMPLPDPPGAKRPKPPEPRYDDVYAEGVAAMEADLPPPLRPGDVLRVIDLGDFIPEEPKR